MTKSTPLFCLDLPLSYGKPLGETLIDAIQVTRNLKVRYIWIDALCILQDSKIDWETESANMSRVYSHAYSTLAASSAADTEAGLTLHQHHPRLRENKMILSYNSYSTSSPQRICIGPPSRDWVTFLEDPLQQRGWVLQERHLSPRIVHFSSTHMIWECRRLRSSNDLPWLDWNDPTYEEMRFTEGMWSWGSLIEEYSGRKLTYGKDKLPAVGRLAAVVKAARNDEYLAGLWRSDLINGLCWSASRAIWDGPPDDSELHARPSKYRAPSWSWASIDGTLQYNKYELDKRSPTIYKASTKLAGSYWLGEVTGGFIKIRGLLRKALCHKPLVKDANARYYTEEVFEVDRTTCIGALIHDEDSDFQLPWQEIYCLRIAPNRSAPYMTKEMPARMAKIQTYLSLNHIFGGLRNIDVLQ